MSSFSPLGLTATGEQEMSQLESPVKPALQNQSIKIERKTQSRTMLKILPLKKVSVEQTNLLNVVLHLSTTVNKG